jgi:hypothetical protein
MEAEQFLSAVCRGELMVAAFVERVEFHARSTPRWKMRAVFGMTQFFLEAVEWVPPF